MIISAFAWWALAPRRTSPPADAVMLLVLPFENMSESAEHQYLADAVTGQMITELARISPARLQVIARTTSFTYRATQKYGRTPFAARQRYWAVMGVAPERVTRLGELFATGGFDAVRREWANWIEGFAKARVFVTSTELALLHAALGDRDRALHWLQQASRTMCAISSTRASIASWIRYAPTRPTARSRQASSRHP